MPCDSDPADSNNSVSLIASLHRMEESLAGNMRDDSTEVPPLSRGDSGNENSLQTMLSIPRNVSEPHLMMVNWPLTSTHSMSMSLHGSQHYLRGSRRMPARQESLRQVLAAAMDIMESDDPMSLAAAARATADILQSVSSHHVVSREGSNHHSEHGDRRRRLWPLDSYFRDSGRSFFDTDNEDEDVEFSSDSQASQ